MNASIVLVCRAFLITAQIDPEQWTGAWTMNEATGELSLTMKDTEEVPTYHTHDVNGETVAHTH